MDRERAYTLNERETSWNKERTKVALNFYLRLNFSHYVASAHK